MRQRPKHSRKHPMNAPVAEATLGRATEAAHAIDEYRTLPPFPFFGHDHAIGIAWSQWANGDPRGARTTLLAEADLAYEGHHNGSAGWLWHDASRLGARGLASKLQAVADSGDSPVVAARALHVTAVEASDEDGLVAAAGAVAVLAGVVLGLTAGRTGQPVAGVAASNRAPENAARR